MFPFDQLGHAARSLVRGAEEAGAALVRTAQDAAGWADDLFSGDVGVQAMPVPVVVDQVMAGNSTSWTETGATSGNAAATHHEIAAGLAAMLSTLEATWTGEGADGARRRTKAFTEVIDRAAQTLSSNGSNVIDAAFGFELAKRSMEPMGEPPDKSFFDVATPWATDTEQAVQAYNAKAEKNLGIYNAYVQHLDTQGKGLSGDYGQLSRVTADRPDRDTGRPVRATADRVATDTPSTPSTQDGHADTEIGGLHSRAASDPGGDEHADGADPRAFVATQHDRTSTAGLAAPPAPGDAGVSGSDSAHQLRRGASTSLPDADGPQLLGVPRSPASPVPNRGAGGPRRGAEQVGTPSRGGGRGTGTRGVAGSAGVAPTGNRRGSAEDAERQRKYVRDDDSVFADVEDGLVDPRTGLAPTPPTIGT
jgi:hypothetical protein